MAAPGFCSKHGHETKAKAKAHLVRLRRTANSIVRDKGDLNIYLCPTCSKWHVGHKPRRRK